MCIYIVVIWFRNAKLLMGKFCQFLSACEVDIGGVLSFHVFINLCQSLGLFSCQHIDDIYLCLLFPEKMDLTV